MIAVAQAWTRPPRNDAIIALLAALAYLALQALGGFQSLYSAADNDSLLRLVEVRDLIGGQGWFDLHQYRMGPSGGFVMHWSRLVDAPIAAIILAARAFGASLATTETIALVVWPTLLFGIALYFLLRAARFFFGSEVLLPALLIGAASLHYISIFAPGSLDHHNVQLVLVLGMLSTLAEASRSNSAISGAAGGVCTALLLGVAMEAAPYVAVAGIATALWFLLTPGKTWRAVSGFGLAFGAGACAIFVATVPPDAWLVSACDTYSLPQFTAAALSGFGIVVLSGSSILRKGAPHRVLALAALGLCLASMVLLFFPQCLSDPYAGLDPRLRSWWLDAVTEAQPVWRIINVDPGLAAGRYGPPLVALIYLAVASSRARPGRGLLLLMALLSAAFLVSLWQVRGSVFSIPLAAIPLAGFVAGRRVQSNSTASPVSVAGMVFAWVVSFNVVWSIAVDRLANLRADESTAVAELTGAAGDCLADDDYGQLGGLPASVVLTISNLGAPVLRYTSHSVLAGPYHRNVEGNLATLLAFVGPVEDAAGIAHRNAVAYVAMCAGNGETRALAQRAPDGLLASLLSGNVPGWLEIIPESRNQPLEIYRVLPAK